jgi:hypothetical protein
MLRKPASRHTAAALAAGIHRIPPFVGTGRGARIGGLWSVRNGPWLTLNCLRFTKIQSTGLKTVVGTRAVPYSTTTEVFFLFFLIKYDCIKKPAKKLVRQKVRSCHSLSEGGNFSVQGSLSLEPVQAVLHLDSIYNDLPSARPSVCPSVWSS